MITKSESKTIMNNHSQIRIIDCQQQSQLNQNYKQQPTIMGNSELKTRINHHIQIRITDDHQQSQPNHKYKQSSTIRTTLEF